MIKPADKLKDIFKDFKHVKKQMVDLNFFFILLFIPFIEKWLKNKTIEQTAALIHTEAKSIIQFINDKIAENTGCTNSFPEPSGCPENISDINEKHIPGFFKSTLSKMERLESSVKIRNPESVVYLDVSDLPAPEPLMKIREALAANPAPEIVRVKHRKLPLHLPGYLEDKSYYVFAEQKNNEVIIYVFDRKLLKVIDE